MSTFNPVNSYNYIDPSTNKLVPVTNSTFVYGIISNSSTSASGTNSSTLTLDLSYGNTQLCSISGRNIIKVSNTGIYRLITTLSFTGSGYTANNVQNLKFGLTKTTVNNANISYNSYLYMLNTSNPVLTTITTSVILSLGNIYSNDAASYDLTNSNSSGAGNNYVVGFLRNAALTSTTYYNSGISVVELILYIVNSATEGICLNIGPNQSGTTVNATGNFMLEFICDTMTNKYVPYYKNVESISGSTFNSTSCYILLQNAGRTPTYTANDVDFGSLDVNTSSFIGNSNIFSIYKPSGSSFNTIKVKYTGIYKVRTSLSFGGQGFGLNTRQGLQFALTTSECDGKTTILSASNSLALYTSSITSPTPTSHKYLSLGYIYSTGYLTSSGSTYKADYKINSGATIIYAYLPVNSTSGGSGLDYRGTSVTEATLFLVKDQPLYFSISPNGGNNYLEGFGNVILELLSVTDTYP